MKRSFIGDNMKLMKYLWFVIDLLIITYFSYMHITVDKDAAIAFIYFMLILTFPSGFLAIFILFMISYLELWVYSIEKHHHVLFIYDIVIPGILFYLAGYVQWFILIPNIKHYFKSQKSVDAQKHSIPARKKHNEK